MLIRPVLVAALAASLAVPAAAGAHAGIKSRSPEPGAGAPRSLGSVKVTFRARVLDANLTVRTASGTTVSKGDGTLSRNKRRISVRLRGGKRAGSYRATVRYLARDGHAQSASWTFRLR